MAGVWVFRNGVFRLENQAGELPNGITQSPNTGKVLVHLPTGELITSYNLLERILTRLGWEKYYGGNPDLLEFHKRSSIDLISLPKDFTKFKSVHMYDIINKNPNVFVAQDM